MKATHIDYLHKRHLRVEADGDVFCMAPSHSQYSALTKRKLPRFGTQDAHLDLARHTTTILAKDVTMFIEGTASQNVYSVDYPQLQWNKLTPEQIVEYQKTWADYARRTNCKYLVVRSIPDALFGEGGPLVVHQETFDNRPWTLTVHVDVKLHPDTVFNRVRDAMLTRLRIAYGPATSYRIFSDELGTVEEGVI